MDRELVATVDGADEPIRVTSVADGRYRVAIGESADVRVYDVDARRVRAGTWSLLIRPDGGGGAAAARSVVVDVGAPDSDGARVSVGAVDAVIALDDARRRRLAQAVAGRSRRVARGEVLRAPIAGVVVAVSVAPGDAVEPGQAACVLEAMKMENEIKAERGGAVVEVHVEAGQSVETGDDLVTLR